MAPIQANPELLQKLEDALIARNIKAGFTSLDKLLTKKPQLDTTKKNSLSLLLCIAQWVDLGYRDISFLELLHSQFAHADVSQLPFIDYLKLQLVEAFLGLSHEDLNRAIALLELTLRAGETVMPFPLVFLSNFWKGRAHRKKGEYALALLHISAARATAERAKESKLVAVTKIHESWLVFQRGERRLAFQLLDEAEEELRSTGHGLSLGNIESARGRFVRRAGEYARALAHFERAIEIYSANYPTHPNHARALVNAAYVKRLIALDMQPTTRGGQARGSTHARSLLISREALEMLRKAGDIYAIHHHQGGTGSVLVNTGHIHLESGDIDKASEEGQKAYKLGEERHDQILMARARILQVSVELARSEEQLGEHPDASMNAQLAVQFAEEAIELATQTQNKRLLAGAYIVRGAAAADEFFQEWELAKEFAAKAAELLGKDDRDHLLKDLSSLKAKTLHATGIDQTLRLWSDGEVGNKTFQQIQEEFAEFVIPKIWMKQGRNITRVAQKLSISPKKIRRILRNSRHLDT